MTVRTTTPISGGATTSPLHHREASDGFISGRFQDSDFGDVQGFAFQRFSTRDDMWDVDEHDDTPATAIWVTATETEANRGGKTKKGTNEKPNDFVIESSSLFAGCSPQSPSTSSNSMGASSNLPQEEQSNLTMINNNNNNNRKGKKKAAANSTLSACLSPTMEESNYQSGATTKTKGKIERKKRSASERGHRTAVRGALGPDGQTTRSITTTHRKEERSRHQTQSSSLSRGQRGKSADPKATTIRSRTVTVRDDRSVGPVISDGRMRGRGRSMDPKVTTTTTTNRSSRSSDNPERRLERPERRLERSSRLSSGQRGRSADPKATTARSRTVTVRDYHSVGPVIGGRRTRGHGRSMDPKVATTTTTTRSSRSSSRPSISESSRREQRTLAVSSAPRRAGRKEDVKGNITANNPAMVATPSRRAGSVGSLMDRRSRCNSPGVYSRPRRGRSMGHLAGAGANVSGIDATTPACDVDSLAPPSPASMDGLRHLNQFLEDQGGHHEEQDESNAAVSINDQEIDQPLVDVLTQTRLTPKQLRKVLLRNHRKKVNVVAAMDACGHQGQQRGVGEEAIFNKQEDDPKDTDVAPPEMEMDSGSLSSPTKKSTSSDSESCAPRHASSRKSARKSSKLIISPKPNASPAADKPNQPIAETTDTDKMTMTTTTHQSMETSTPESISRVPMAAELKRSAFIGTVSTSAVSRESYNTRYQNCASMDSSSHSTRSSNGRTPGMNHDGRSVPSFSSSVTRQEAAGCPRLSVWQMRERSKNQQRRHTMDYHTSTSTTSTTSTPSTTSTTSTPPAGLQLPPALASIRRPMTPISDRHRRAVGKNSKGSATHSATTNGPPIIVASISGSTREEEDTGTPSPVPGTSRKTATTFLSTRSSRRHSMIPVSSVAIEDVAPTTPNSNSGDGKRLSGWQLRTKEQQSKANDLPRRLSEGAWASRDRGGSIGEESSLPPAFRIAYSQCPRPRSTGTLKTNRIGKQEWQRRAAVKQGRKESVKDSIFSALDDACVSLEDDNGKRQIVIELY